MQFLKACPVLMPLPAFRFATSPAPAEGGESTVLWLLKRPRSLAPIQLAWSYGYLCLISLGIATFFWVRGATLVMIFALVELIAVGVALLLYSRHAGDTEKIVLRDGHLVIELATAGRTERAEFDRDWVRIEPKDGDGSLIEVSGRGRLVRVGRHLRPELRPALAREIRFALRVC